MDKHRACYLGHRADGTLGQTIVMMGCGPNEEVNLSEVVELLGEFGAGKGGALIGNVALGFDTMV